MNPLKVLQKSLGLLYDLVDRLSSQKAVSEALSVTDGHVSRLLLGTRDISLKETFNLLGFLDVPPQLVIEMACEDQPVTPAQWLRAFRKGDGLTAASFLEAVEARLPPPGSQPPQLTARPTGSRSTLLELENNRLADAATVKEKLEALVIDWSRQELVSAELRVDIATALAIWASIQRIQEHHDDAATACTFAFRFVEGLDEPWILGLLYRKVAPLLVGLKRPHQALQFLKEALVFFIEAGETDFQAQIYVDLGLIHNTLGQVEKAQKWHALALRHLLENDEVHRYAVYYDLAWAQFQAGHLAAAQENLAAARKFQPTNNVAVETSLLWLEGDISRKSGDTSDADRAYRKTVQNLLSQSRFPEAIQVTLALAQTLLDARQTAPLKELMLELQKIVKKLRTNSAAAGAIDALSLAFFQGKIGPKLFEDASTKFGAALDLTRGRSDQS